MQGLFVTQACVFSRFKILIHVYLVTSLTVDGNWTSWGAWSQCTKTCGLSYRKRSRSCTDPAPQYGGGGCDGQNDQVERCTGKPCK